MFLVVPDPAHGLVVAPRSSLDLTRGTEEALTAQGFTWDSRIEAYTRQTDSSPAAVERTAGTLRELGHYVFSSITPLPHQLTTPAPPPATRPVRRRLARGNAPGRGPAPRVRPQQPHHPLGRRGHSARTGL